jgi:hypothetical protein
MRFAGATTEFTFADGARSSLDIVDAGQRPVHFERWAAPTVTRSALAAYAGDYYSEELDARYKIVADDSTITLFTGTETGVPGRPIFADVFLAGGFTVQFTRNGSAVTGFELTGGRTRHVRFVRQVSGRP